MREVYAGLGGGFAMPIYSSGLVSLSQKIEMQKNRKLFETYQDNGDDVLKKKTLSAAEIGEVDMGTYKIECDIGHMMCRSRDGD